MFSKLLLLALGVSAYAQDFGSQLSLVGKIVGPAGRLDRLRIEAVSDASHRSEATTWASMDGEFELRSLASGGYQVRVINLSGEPLASVPVEVPAMRPLHIELPSLGQTGAPEPVSTYRLSHMVPGKALKAYRKATDRLRRGDKSAAAALYEQAIAADPDYADALHMRGLYAYESKDYTSARRLLVRAAKLDDANAGYQADAAAAGYAANAFAEAEGFSRSALRLEPALPKAKFVLALSLLRLGRSRQQALEALRGASASIPSAAALLSRLTAQ